MLYEPCSNCSVYYGFIRSWKCVLWGVELVEIQQLRVTYTMSSVRLLYITSVIDIVNLRTRAHSAVFGVALALCLIEKGRLRLAYQNR